MRWSFLLTFLLAFMTRLLADPPPIKVDIKGIPTDYRVFWTTRPFYSYSLEKSQNLESWSEIVPMEPGTGLEMSYSFSTIGQPPKTYYRVREHCLGFLSRPQPDEVFYKDDGVCIAFNPDCLPLNTTVLCINLRSAGGTWQPIGKVTDFLTVGTKKYVRGSSIWLPNATGSFEIQAIAKNGGAVLQTDTRTVSIIANPVVDVSIVSGPPASSPDYFFFTTQVYLSSGEPVSRVEFYDNGVLVGEDVEAPFGDDILDKFKTSAPVPYKLLRGNHQITAIGYDSRGKPGPVSPPYPINVATGNARPVLSITSPSGLVTLSQNTLFNLSFTASDADGNTTITRVEAKDEKGEVIAFDATGQGTMLQDVSTFTLRLGPQCIKVTARDSSGAESYPQYLNVCIVPPNGITGEQLAASIADPVTAAPSNAKLSGHPAACDLFSNGIASGLMLECGAVLTTGRANWWNGGDFLDDRGEPWYLAGDRVIEDRVVGRNTHDAAVLEFDVLSTNGQLEGEYQFGSEEYDEYVVPAEYSECRNDAFLTTVNGAIATWTPDCGDIVACHSIHPLIRYSFSKCKHLLSGDIPPTRQYLYLDNDNDIKPLVLPGLYGAEYDGMTTALKWRAFVTPGQIYRVRTVIVDVDDQAYDSALFIGAGTIRSINPLP